VIPDYSRIEESKKMWERNVKQMDQVVKTRIYTSLYIYIISNKERDRESDSY
jgi:hypothetical protein